MYRVSIRRRLKRRQFGYRYVRDDPQPVRWPMEISGRRFAQARLQLDAAKPEARYASKSRKAESQVFSQAEAGPP
jgi:hypothetical protein